MYRYLNSLLCYLNFFYDIPNLISRVHYMLSLGVIKRTVGKFVSKNNACILFIFLPPRKLCQTHFKGLVIHIYRIRMKRISM